MDDDDFFGGDDIHHGNLSFPTLSSTGTQNKAGKRRGRNETTISNQRETNINVGPNSSSSSSVVSSNNFGGILNSTVTPHDPNTTATTATTKKKSKGGFQSLGLSKPVLSGILRLGYKLPTPIQRSTLPEALSGKDIVAMARTGSGKTAAFLIPMLERLKEHSSRIGARAVILSPTRELALQTLRFAQALAKFTDLRFASIVGGDSMEGQFAALSKNPDVLIATPGRLIHHLREVPGFTLKLVEYIVFDEADRLFEMGFKDQLTDLLHQIPEHRQALLISATLPKVLVAFAKAGLRNPSLIRLDVDAKVSENLRLGFFTVRKEEKPSALVWILRYVIPADQQAIVFVATRHHCEYLNNILQKANISSETIYGNMDMTARKSNLSRFVARKLSVLVVTDVAARGLDIPLLDNVINYDFPDKAKLFVHRVGRVARQGRIGAALSLVSSMDVPYMLDFLLFLGRPLSNVYFKEGNKPRHAFVDGDDEEINDHNPNDGEEEDNDDENTVQKSKGKSDSSQRNRKTNKNFVMPEHNDDDDDSVAVNSVNELQSLTSFASSATALTNIARFDDGDGYTLTTMTPADVHYGRIPRSSLEHEIEAVRGWLASDVSLRHLAKSATNAYELYYKTRAEASRQSAARAHKLVDDRVHPLLMQYGEKGETKLQSYIAGLQAFRPAQTIMEIEGATKKNARGMTGSAVGPEKQRTLAVVEAMNAKRKFHSHAVQPRIGSVSLAAATVAAAKGSLAMNDNQIGDALRQGIIGVASSVGDTVEEMVERYQNRQKQERIKKLKEQQQNDSDDDSNDDEDDVEDDVNDDFQNDDEYNNENDSDNDDDDAFDDDDDAFDDDDEDAENDHKSVLDELRAVHAPSGKRRLSRAERKRLEKLAHQTSLSSSSNTSNLEKGRQQQQQESDRAVAQKNALKDAGIRITNSNIHENEVTTVTGNQGTRLKSERRRLLREGTNETVAQAFVDKQHYVSFLPLSEAATEAMLGPKGTAAAAERKDAGRGDTVASDLTGLMRFEDNAFDLLGDEKDNLSKNQRKVNYWDPVKKRYLRLTPDQVEHGRRKISSIKTESGANVKLKTNSKDTEYGSTYRQWVKKTRKQIEGGGEENGNEDEDGNANQQRYVEFGDNDNDGGGNNDNGGGGGRSNNGKNNKRGRGNGNNGGSNNYNGKGGGNNCSSHDNDNRSFKRRRQDGNSDGNRGTYVKDQLRSASQIKQERERQNRGKGIFGRRGSSDDRSRNNSTSYSKPAARGKGTAPSRMKVLGKHGAKGFGIQRGGNKGNKHGKSSNDYNRGGRGGNRR